MVTLNELLHLLFNPVSPDIDDDLDRFDIPVVELQEVVDDPLA